MPELEKQGIDAVLAAAPVVRLGFADNGEPYVVPVNFAYKNNALYIHIGIKGRKYGLLQRGARICFEVEGESALKTTDTACKHGFMFTSVIGWGRPKMLADDAARREALGLIMLKYTGKSDWSFGAESLARTAAVRIDIESMTGKQRG
ncbi:MAG: pyridoxamine 5'-phosphate oxidase family protein [Planctomycetota bacterium]